MLTTGRQGTGWTRPSASLAVMAILTGSLVLLVVLQVLASASGFQGPLASLASDYVLTPKSATVPWAGLALAIVGIDNRRRILALGAAAGLDVLFAGERLLRGGVLTVGNGPTIVLTALAVVAWRRWDGADRRNALHAVGLGALLILATKVGDTWLQFTVMWQPNVWDEYTLLADHALGSPSWLFGRAVEAMGPVGYGILHWVYIELPLAAMVVTVWQLRNVVSSGQWPAHYLVRTFLAVGLIGPAIYVLFPVVGPISAFGSDGEGFQLGNYWPDVVPTLDGPPTPMPFNDHAPRNCMPSMHTAWALVVFLHSRGGPRWLRYGGTVWLACTIVATLGFGYHYAVDLVAGALLCLTVESALREPERGWGWFRVRLLIGGTGAFVGLLLSCRLLAESMAAHPVVFGVLILGALAAVALTFYATFFARAGTPLARWGGRRPPAYAVPAE